MTEIWLPVHLCDYDGIYEVSNIGRVKALEKVVPCGRYLGGSKVIPEAILIGEISKAGYHRVILSHQRRVRKYSVHILVAQEFIGLRPSGLQVCHNNGDKLDNRVENLRYDTPSANIRDSIRHGTNNQKRKTHCPQKHEYDDENTYLFPTSAGWGRQCRACHRDQERERRSRERQNGKM